MHAGVQLAKLSPFRSSIVLFSAAVGSVFGQALNFDVLHVHLSVSMALCA